MAPSPATRRAGHNPATLAPRARIGLCSPAMVADWQEALERARAHAPISRAARSTACPSWRHCSAAGDGEAALAWARAGRARASTMSAAALRRERLALFRRRWRSAIWRAPSRSPRSRANCRPSRTARSTRRSARRSPSGCPTREPAGMIALALGKQGASELNYSSDIDPILLYDPAHPAAPRARRAGRGGAALRPRGRPPAERGDRRRLRLPGRLAAASGVRGQPAGDPGRRRADALRKLGARVGAGGVHPRARGGGRYRGGRARSSPRSARSCGAAASISARSARSAG